MKEEKKVSKWRIFAEVLTIISTPLIVLSGIIGLVLYFMGNYDCVPFLLVSATLFGICFVLLGWTAEYPKYD